MILNRKLTKLNNIKCGSSLSMNGFGSPGIPALLPVTLLVNSAMIDDWRILWFSLAFNEVMFVVDVFIAFVIANSASMLGLISQRKH